MGTLTTLTNGTKRAAAKVSETGPRIDLLGSNGRGEFAVKALTLVTSGETPLATFKLETSMYDTDENEYWISVPNTTVTINAAGQTKAISVASGLQRFVRYVAGYSEISDITYDIPGVLW